MKWPKMLFLSPGPHLAGKLTDTAVPLQPARGPCCEVTLRLLLNTTGVISHQGVEMREATPQLLR